MLKYLLIISLGAIVWWYWKRPSPPPGSLPRRETPPEPMVACAHCGVLSPQSETLAEGGRQYCCEAHRRAGSDQSPR